MESPLPVSHMTTYLPLTPPHTTVTNPFPPPPEPQAPETTTMGPPAFQSLSIKDKHVLITGGGSGINLAFATLCLQRGAAGVLIGDLALRPAATSLLESYPGRAHFHKTDVTSWPSLASLFAQAVSLFPSVDVVVPGAGIFDPHWSNFWEAPVTATNKDSRSKDRADRTDAAGGYAVYDINVTHPTRLSQLAIGHWTTRREPGQLVFIGSLAGIIAGFMHPIYHASKWAVHGFVRSLGQQSEKYGIRCGVVAPAGVKTPMLLEEESKAVMAREGDADKLVTPEEIAEVMLDLCEKPEWGNGPIVEVIRPGARRVVPEFNADPPGDRMATTSGFAEEHEALLTKLRHQGLKV